MEAVGRLAGGIAHDFNNLLTAISGYTNLLIRSLDPAHPGRDDAEEIRRMAEQAASLTRQILAFSRRQVMRPEVIDLNRVIRDTESMLRRLIGEDVDLSTHLAGDLEPVRADPGQIEQVLLNLVVNSRDAMPRGGSLSIATCNEPGASGAEPRVRLEVTDTGAGMDAETQARAFDPFFTTKDRFKGTGLGLSTVYGIVQQSGGSIALQSRPALGTTVEIVLPAAAGRPAALRVPAVAPAPVRGSETVLLAEDEPTVRRLLHRILDESGYRVLEASNGAEALERAEAHEGTLHLVITDVIMPEMGGTELVERMKHVHPEAKVLYISGYADEALGQRGVVPGNEAFLAKPFTPEALARKVREILDAPTRA
jgi:CheY-like chemotaxis protein